MELNDSVETQLLQCPDLTMFKYYHLHQWCHVKVRSNTDLLVKLPEVVPLMTS